MTANVLATGCSGFLGRHCMEALVRNGFRVHAVSRSPHADAADGITWHNLDLHVPGAAERLIATLRPSHLLHLAWVTTPDRYRYAAENLDWLEASLALVKAFGEHGGQRFVGVGSSAEYDVESRSLHGGRNADPPGFPYGQCKAAVWMSSKPMHSVTAFPPHGRACFCRTGRATIHGASFRPCWLH